MSSLRGHCRAMTEYFERLDGDDPESVLELLAPDYRFATLWGEEEFARPSAGGAKELVAYFASRDPSGQRHHLLHGMTSDDGLEVAAGYTTRNGEFLATFVAALRLDDSGCIRRFFSARTPTLSLLD